MKDRKRFFWAVLLIGGLILSGCDDLFGGDSDDNSSNNNNNYGSITVTPGSVTLVRGETQQFTANQSYVTWSLSGATGNSSINSSGLLTVGVDETAAALTVTASKSNYDSGTARVTIAAPSATPQGLMASRPGPDSIELSWQALSEAGQYTVSRSTNGTNFGQIGTTSGTSYTDTAVSAGSSYYYRISVNGVNSNVIFVFTADYFNMPTYSQRKLVPLITNDKHYYRMTVTQGNSYTITWHDGNDRNIPGPEYSWSPRHIVTAYQNDGTQIFSRNSGGYTNPAVFTATATGFVTIEVHSSGQDYDYQIYQFGENFTEDNGTVALPPYQVTAFIVSSPSTNSITLTWNPASDANRYNIYRSNSQTGASFKIGESSNTSYTDNQVSAGLSFWYSIAAVNADGRESSRFYGTFGFAASHYTLLDYNSAQKLALTNSNKHYYRLAVTQGNSYTITWQDGNDRNIPGPEYSWSPRHIVTAYQNNGTQIFSRNSGGYTNPAVFTATATGFVTIEVHSSGQDYDYQIYYY